MKILRKVEEKFINIGKKETSKEVYEGIVNTMKQYAQTDTDFNEKYNKIINEAMSDLNSKT